MLTPSSYQVRVPSEQRSKKPLANRVSARLYIFFLQTDQRACATNQPPQKFLMFLPLRRRWFHPDSRVCNLTLPSQTQFLHIQYTGKQSLKQWGNILNER